MASSASRTHNSISLLSSRVKSVRPRKQATTPCSALKSCLARHLSPCRTCSSTCQRSRSAWLTRHVRDNGSPAGRRASNNTMFMVPAYAVLRTTDAPKEGSHCTANHRYRFPSLYKVWASCFSLHVYGNPYAHWRLPTSAMTSASRSQTESGSDQWYQCPALRGSGL
jgi:hypothetical protein